MKFLFFFLFLLVFALIFLGLNAIIRRMAYPKNRRYLHCRLVFAVFIAELIAGNVYTITYIIRGADAVINAKWLQPILNVILPNRAYELLYMILSLLSINLIMTVLILLVIAIVKLIFRTRTNFQDYEEYMGFEKVLHLPWIMTRKNYVDVDGDVALSERGFVFGLWAKGLKRVFIVLWFIETVALAVSVLWGPEEWNTWLLEAVKAWYLLPMAGFLFFEQVQFFFEGIYEDSTTSFGSEDIGERLEGSVETLIGFYRRTFGNSGALLYSDYDRDGISLSDGLSGNSPGNRQIKDSSQPEIFEVISSQLRFSGVQQNENYLNAIVDLLSGNSINVCDCIEGEFFPYLVAYLNFYLSQGKTAVVLCTEHDDAEKLCEVINDRMQMINSLYSVWNIRTVEGLRENKYINILVCTGEELVDSHVLDKRPDFAGDLFCVVLAGGYHMFSQDSVHIELLFNELRKVERELRYVMLTEEDNDTLRTTVEIFIKQNMAPVNNTLKRPKTGIMIWKAESCYRLQRYINVGASALSLYIGPALPLALLAVKYDLPQIYIIPDKAIPEISYSDALQMNTKEIQKYLAKSVNLKSVLRYSVKEALAPQDISMMIVYDNSFNFYNAMWEWVKYGGKDGTLLHIISPPYLLREFFIAGFGESHLYLKNNEFSAFVPYSLGMKSSRMAVMLVSLCDTGMTETELMDIVKRYDWPYETVDALLNDCLKILFLDDEVHNIYECFHFEETKRFIEDRDAFEHHTRITVTDHSIARLLRARISCASLVQKDNQRRTLPILENNLYNYYLDGQIAVFDDHTYVISSVKNGCVYAEQEIVRDAFSYFPISSFSFGANYHVKDACVDTDYLDINLCSSAVTRRIYGYWSNNRGNNFNTGSVVQINDLRDASFEPITVTHQKTGVLELNLRRCFLGKDPEKTVLLLAYMLSDLFKTLFPATYQNLFVVTERPEGSLIDDIFSAGADNPVESIIHSIIPYSTDAPRSNDDFVTLYIVEFSSVEFGMLLILKNRIRNVIAMVREYLRWYLDARANAPESATYLGFGYEGFPSCFAPEDLLEYCLKAVPIVDEPELMQVEEEIDLDTCCTFCGRASLFTTILDDGRRMCGNCKDHQLLQKQEVKDLYLETVRFMQEGYSIKMPKRIQVRFQSARTIRAAAGETSGGRILGFYQHSSRQLWLEARGPRIAMLSTLIHELTHAWQHAILNLKALKAALPGINKEQKLLEVLEGHAVYTEIETLKRQKELDYAERLEKITLMRDDEYSRGYQYMLEEFHQITIDEGSLNPFALMLKWAERMIKGKGDKTE